MNPTDPMSRILIVEDETPMRVGLHDCLAAEGYRVLSTSDGVKGLNMALAERPDLLLLDIMMPGLDGYAVAGELRRLGQSVAILMLTARGQIKDRVAGLDAGADDYLVKPFSTDELLARVRSMLRRQTRTRRAIQKIQCDDVIIDLSAQLVTRAGQVLHLTPKEFAMLKLLVETSPEPVSRERFLDVVWGYTAFPTTRTVDNHIASLRAKVEVDPENPRLIRTVHGAGYRFHSAENFAKP